MMKLPFHLPKRPPNDEEIRDPSDGNGKDARPVPWHKQLSIKEQSTLD
jgi:hypothetical protein